jgi:hypothetical protein
MMSPLRRMCPSRATRKKEKDMTIDPAVNLVSLLAGIDPATLNAVPVDARANLSALLAGIPASRDATGGENRRTVVGSRPANAQDPRAVRC